MPLFSIDRWGADTRASQYRPELGTPFWNALVAAAAGLTLSACATAPVVDRIAASRPGSSFQDCPTCPQMVVVPAGSFQMGFDGGEPERYEGPVRTVRIGYSFAVGRFEVTNRQYREFLGATGHVSAKGCFGLRGATYKLMPGTNWENPGYGRPIVDDEPVACVDWNDSKAYVTWLSRLTGKPYRLLTEAEWEYAARAGRAGRFTWDDAPQRACEEANVFDQSAARTRPDASIPAAPCDDGFPELAPVGRRAPNPFGLYDMIGNVWEWVEDCYTMPHLVGAPVDGSAQIGNGCDRRGSRGGAWLSSLDRQRPAFRGRDPMDRVSQIFGLRVARD